MHALAQQLNETLQTQSPVAFRLLSDRGQRLFFPKLGIMAQSADAKGKKFNATIGIGTDEDGTPLHFPFFDDVFQVPAGDVYPYASSYGKPELREQWQQMMRAKNPSLGACLL